MAISRNNSRQRSPTSPAKTSYLYFVVQTKWYLQSQTVWLPRLLNCISGCYSIPSPKGEGFTDPLTGTLKGFGIRVTPTGYKSFIIDYRPGEGGRRVLKKRMVIGVVGKITCEQARAIARKKLAQVQLGKNPAAEREQKRRMLTFAEMAQRYVSEEAPRRLKRGTITNYEINLRRHANLVIGGTKISELTRSNLIAMHNEIGTNVNAGVKLHHSPE